MVEKNGTFTINIVLSVWTLLPAKNCRFSNSELGHAAQPEYDFTFLYCSQNNTAWWRTAPTYSMNGYWRRSSNKLLRSTLCSPFLLVIATCVLFSVAKSGISNSNETVGQFDRAIFSRGRSISSESCIYRIPKKGTLELNTMVKIVSYHI